MFSTDFGWEPSQAIVPVTPPAIGAQAVLTAARSANSRVAPEALAQFVRPWYSMQTFTETCDMFIVE